MRQLVSSIRLPIGKKTVQTFGLRRTWWFKNNHEGDRVTRGSQSRLNEWGRKNFSPSEGWRASQIAADRSVWGQLGKPSPERSSHRVAPPGTCLPGQRHLPLWAAVVDSLGGGPRLVLKLRYWDTRHTASARNSRKTRDFFSPCWHGGLGFVSKAGGSSPGTHKTQRKLSALQRVSPLLKQSLV